MAVIWAAPSGCQHLALCHLFRSLFTRINSHFVTVFSNFVLLMHSCDSINLKYSRCHLSVVPVPVCCCQIQHADNLYLDDHKWDCFFHPLWLCPILLPASHGVRDTFKQITQNWDCHWIDLLHPRFCLVLVSTTTHFTSGGEASVFPPLLYLKEVPK